MPNLVTLTLALGVALSVASIVAASRTLSGQTEVLINDELARDGVAGSAESEANDDSERVQLRRDLLELSETLRDGVASLVLLGDGSQHARRLPEHSKSSGRTHLGVSGEGLRNQSPEVMVQLEIIGRSEERRVGKECRN